MTESFSILGAWSVCRRNITLYSKTWKLNLLPNFFEPVFLLLGIGLGLGFYVTQVGGIPYPIFLAPGLVAMAAMNGASFETTYNVYVRMNYDRVYDAMIATPLSETEIVMGEILWAVIRSVIYGGAFLLMTYLFGFIPSGWGVLSILAVALVGYFFATMGIVFSCTVPTIDLFSFYYTLFLTPLYIFSDTFFPIRERLGETWMWVAEATPLFHGVRLIRSLCLGELSFVLWWDIAYLVLIGLFFNWIAVRRFRNRIHKPTR